MEETVILSTWPGVQSETLTVGGLIKVLSLYDKNLPVVATWEGVRCPVQKDSICVMESRFNNIDIDVLFLDVDEYF